MAAIFADAAVFKAFSKESISSSYDDEKTSFSSDLWCNARLQEPCPCTRQDFIIFAEFSEVMGPIPLLTIPIHGAEKAGVDINSFIMRLMSVDYQANPSQSIFCEDAQVLKTFVMPNFHAYVHYLTLHDPGARGFVRPLCLAYVTADQHKLTQLFPKLRNQFLQVTQLIKYNNRLWFRDEIKNIIHCIKESQYKYLSWKKKEEDGVPISDEGKRILDQTNMDQLVQQSTDFNHMLHALEPLLKEDAPDNCAIIEAWQKGFEEAEKSEMIISVYSITSRIGNSTNHLKGILALSPWGLSAALWNLLRLLHAHRECRLKLVSDKIPHCDWEVLNNGVHDALCDNEFLRLMNCLIRPPDLTSSKPASSSGGGLYAGACSSRNSLDLLEASVMTSCNEVASSYHSVPESLSEILAGTYLSGSEGEEEVNRAEEVFPGLLLTDDASSNDSYLDVSETGSMSEDNWSVTSPEHIDEKKSHCVWSCQKSGTWLLKFFQTYEKVAHHLFYSLLIGRTVVLVGNESSEHKASLIMNALSPYVPIMPGQEVQILRWRCGTLMPSHISSYHMIGVCIPERLSVHDLISSKDKNLVTILDVCSKQFFGPAYSGRILGSLEKVAHSLPSDQSMMLILQSISASLNEKLFMYLTLMKTNPSADKPQMSPGSEVLRGLGLEGCDAEIVRNMSKIGCVNWKPFI